MHEEREDPGQDVQHEGEEQRTDDHDKGESTGMPFLMSILCVIAGMKRWISKQVPRITKFFISIYMFIFRHQRPTPMYRAFVGTADEADN